MNVLLTSPSSTVPICLKAASDKSMELLPLQVGQSSSIVTVTDLLVFVLTILTFLPQSADFFPESP